MASTSQQIQAKITLDYEQVKRNYFNILAKNKELLKEPLCTREAIEEKIKMFTTNPREIQDLIMKNVNGKNRLYVKKNSWKNIEIIPIDEAFNVLLKAHVACNHGNKSATYDKVTKEYSLPMFSARWIVESCNVCNSSKRPEPDETEVAMKSSNKSGRGLWRLNIIDHNFLPRNSGRASFLLILKEDTTNFVILRPLYESLEEFALDLVKVFSEFGYPEKICVPNMITFYKKILSLVYFINPEVRVPVEEVNNSEIFEKDKQEVLKEIQNWTRMTEDVHWEQSCHLVQYKLNTTEKLFTRLFSNENSVGVPFQEFFNYRFRTRMTWKHSPFAIINTKPHKKVMMSIAHSKS